MLFFDFNALCLQFHSFCIVIWCRLHGYLSQNMKQTGASYGVIWCKLHGFSAWFHSVICFIFRNVLTVSMLRFIEKQLFSSVCREDSFQIDEICEGNRKYIWIELTHNWFTGIMRAKLICLAQTINGNVVRMTAYRKTN